MDEAAIFAYGFVVFGIVSAACWLIIWGIVQERRDRETLDAGPDARPEAAEHGAVTEADGRTVPAAEAGD